MIAFVRNRRISVSFIITFFFLYGNSKIIAIFFKKLEKETQNDRETKARRFVKEKMNSKAKKLRKEIKNSKKIEMSFQIVAILYTSEVSSQKKYGEDLRNGF